MYSAVARDDLKSEDNRPVQGVERVQLKDTTNVMVDKLGQFAKEVTRVSQDIGKER